VIPIFFQDTPQLATEEIPALLESISKVCESADLLYEKIQEINNHTVSADFPMVSGLSSKLLHIFRKMQDYFVRLDWQDAVCFPHAAASQNLCHLEQAVHALESQNITAALEVLYEVDNNCYAFLFDEEVYYHFTEYILHQPKDRLMWGAGRILHHENLYGLVQRLKELDQMAIPGSLDVEIRRLEAAIRRQQAYLKDDLHYMKQSVDKIQALINDCLETSSHYNKEKNGENQ
jgi:N-acetylated-alpha-linked acidic dipeptidase